MPTPLTLFPDEAETIEGTGAALRAGRTACAAVLKRCFARIDEWEPLVHAWVVIDRDGAAAQARALDAELAAGKCRGPLHGIPIGVKDVIDVAGLPTAAGFAPWRDRVAGKDAEVLARLRRAGAVILGKTVTTQFAWIDPPVTRNPWNLERTPGGSSSGSAAAVATGMCLGALGTQTGGSIVRPAAFCGVAGYKPKHPAYDVRGVQPLAPTFDQPGPIARTTRDLKLLHEPLHDDDFAFLVHPPFDGTVGAVGRRVRVSLLSDERPPKLLRPRGFYDRRAEPEALEAFERTLSAFAAAGAEVIDLAEGFFDFEAALTRHRLMTATEAAAEHEGRWRERPESLARHILSLVEEGVSIPAPDYVRAAGALYHDRVEWEGPREAIVTPAAVGPAPDTSSTGNPCFNTPWSYLGWPAVSIPTGLSADGLPLAVQLAIVDGSDDKHTLFPAAFWCEDVIRRAARAGSD